MRFCVISPTRGLNRFSALSNVHLVLAHIRNKEYIEFYRQRSEAGDKIILDNGAYEDKLQEMEFILQRAQEVKAAEIVLPDLLLEHWEDNLILFHNILKRYGRELDDYQVMAVPQAKPGDKTGYIQCLEEMLEVPTITSIGIARAVATDIGLSRVEVVQRINDYGTGVLTHALGMVNGNISELVALNEAQCDRVDSSAPVWRGWNGWAMDDIIKWPDYPCDFDADWEPKTIDLIYENLEVCGAYAGDLELVGRCVRHKWERRHSERRIAASRPTELPK